MLHILDIYVVILLFQVGQRSTVKNYCPVNLLSVVSKVFEKLVNNMLVDDLEKYGLFSDYQYGYRSSQLTADPLTVVSGRIARAFNRSGATQAVALDISKAFERVWNASLLSSMEFRVRYLALFRLFLVTEVFKWFWMGISAQKYPNKAGIPQGSILGCMFFLQYINDLPYHVISNVVFCAHDTTLYSKCGQTSDL